MKRKKFSRLTSVISWHRSIETGKLADLVLLDANPLTNIRNTRRIVTVIVDGRVYRRPALDSLLREAESLAAKY